MQKQIEALESKIKNLENEILKTSSTAGAIQIFNLKKQHAILIKELAELLQKRRGKNGKF